MKMLSKEGFQAARHYLMENGREVEKALFQFHFEGGTSQQVLMSLEDYQGIDGGFKNMGEGHGKITNAMDTCLAFHYLSEIGANAKEEMVQKGIQYLIDTYDSTLKCWHPRPGQKSDGWVDNPCAELTGFLCEYKELVPSEFLQEVMEKAIASMSSIHTTNEMKQFYFLHTLCLLRLAERMEEPYKGKIVKQLRNEILEIMETNPDKWSTTYCAKPFFFAKTPASPVFEIIKEHVNLSLENEIETQAEDGHFILNWQTKDEEDARVWKSIWTLDVLRTLQQHNRIEI